MSFVVIGSGASGIEAVRTLRNANERIPVTMITMENRPGCSIPALSSFLAGEIDEKVLFRIPKDFFEKEGITLIQGKVQQVSAKDQKVILEDAREISYQKLLIATGAGSIIPPIPGIEKQGVFSLVSYEDAVQIKSWEPKRAVVVGGGFIGVETACALKKLGSHVTIVELLDSILARMLDQNYSSRVQDFLERNGIRVLTGNKGSKVVGNGKVSGIMVDGEPIPCDTVVFSIGVKPNIDLVQQGEVETNQGILVDDMMRTSQDGVYAAGDVAEFRSFPNNLVWLDAVEQGRIAALNMMGKNVSQTFLPAINILNVFDVPVVSIWDKGGIQRDGINVDYESKDVFKRLILKEGKCVGYECFGSADNTGHILSLIRRRIEIDEGSKLLRSSLNASQIKFLGSIK